MWLTDVSIRRPVFILMIVLAFIVLGFQGCQRMTKELNPKTEFPYISIVTVYPGAGPQEIETLVSKPIEESVGSTANLRNITSSSQDGVSVVSMEFQLGTSLDAAAADVRDKLSAVRGQLPKDIEEPSISKMDISAEPVMTVALDSKNMSGRDLRILADKMIKDKFSRVGGVASVTVNGGDVREVSVAIDRDRLQAYGLSIDQVSQALRAENLNLPSGSVNEGDKGTESRTYAVRTVGEFKNAEEISNIKLGLQGDGGGTVRLGDIATVTDTIQEASTRTRLNGKDTVVIAIQKQSDANTVDVANGINKEIQFLNGFTEAARGEKIVHKPLLPEGTKIIVATDSSEFVKDSLHDVNKSLFEGIILVVLIVFLFLHSGRATVIVATAIPTSLIATFLPMWAFGFTMNMMTMLALSLCVGILVDDSIVVLENIERHVRKGETPKVAALNGRSEIGLAAVTITLVDVVVFVPIAFMGGIVGQFFRQFGITVAIATLFSLFMSFTLTPMLASRWLRSREEEEVVERRTPGFFGRLFARFEKFYSMLDAKYRGILEWALDNRALTFAIGALTLFAVIGLAMPMPFAKASGVPAFFKYFRLATIAITLLTMGIIARKSKSRGVVFGYTSTIVLLLMSVSFPFGFDFMPKVDRGEVAIAIELPSGSGLDATDKVVRKVEGLLKEVKGLEYYQSTVGSSSSGHLGAGSRGGQYARISVKLYDRGPKRPESIDDVIAKLTEETATIPGAEFVVAISGGEGSGTNVAMEITGSNMDELIRVASEVEAKVKQVPGAIDVKNSWDVGKPEMQVSIDRTRAADMGVSVAQIASAVRTSIEGSTDAKLRDAGEEYDIRVRLAKFDRESTADIANVIVGHRDSAPIYLSDVAEVKLAAAPNRIDRKNRQRLITISANPAPGASLGAVQGAIQKAIADVPLGSTRIGTGGMGQIMMESFGYMISALFLAIILVYMLMGALFDSFVTPITIMLSLPQAMIGGFLALMMTGNNMSIVTMIGIIMLVGLVTKNAILLVDYTHTLRERGYSRREAILEAGPTRLRPILMTTLAMVGGMLPTALALSKGSEQRAPMAITVIGGLILSTLLTLLVIPTLYTIVDDFVGGATRKVRRLFGLPEPKAQLHESMEASSDGHHSEEETAGVTSEF